MKWISVKDRLPEAVEQNSGEYHLNDDILIYLENGKAIIGNYYSDQLMGTMEFVISSADFFDDLHEEVTHWMPLPPPPKD